ncbi:hypothetical protein Q3G72_027107 [Acer saccharum]|nr:hypothetical protein Q3G72_027107 [Acer saccharum]
MRPSLHHPQPQHKMLAVSEVLMLVVVNSRPCKMYDFSLFTNWLFALCLNNYGSDISKCQFYMAMLQECRRSNGAAALGA